VAAPPPQAGMEGMEGVVALFPPPEEVSSRDGNPAAPPVGSPSAPAAAAPPASTPAWPTNRRCRATGGAPTADEMTTSDAPDARPAPTCSNRPTSPSSTMTGGRTASARCLSPTRRRHETTRDDTTRHDTTRQFDGRGTNGLRWTWNLMHVAMF